MALNSCKQVKVYELKVSCIFAVIMTNSNVFEIQGYTLIDYILLIACDNTFTEMVDIVWFRLIDARRRKKTDWKSVNTPLWSLQPHTAMQIMTSVCYIDGGITLHHLISDLQFKFALAGCDIIVGHRWCNDDMIATWDFGLSQYCVCYGYIVHDMVILCMLLLYCVCFGYIVYAMVILCMIWLYCVWYCYIVYYGYIVYAMAILCMICLYCVCYGYIVYDIVILCMILLYCVCYRYIVRWG